MTTDGRFAQFMQSAMKVKRISLRDLSQKVDFSYEHLRGIANGKRQPSDPLLERLCKVVGLDYNQMQPLVTGDRMERQHGRNSLAAAFDKSPRLAEYEQLAPLLTDEQTRTVLQMMRSLVKANRKSAK
jgi:transcriptional regulator with XRE-family HTH domain